MIVTAIVSTLALLIGYAAGASDRRQTVRSAFLRGQSLGGLIGYVEGYAKGRSLRGDAVAGDDWYA